MNTQRTTGEGWQKKSSGADSGFLSVSVWSSYDLMQVSSSVFSCEYFPLGDFRTMLIFTNVLIKYNTPGRIMLPAAG